MTLGERLAKIRKENNYRQKDLSIILNVSQQVISNIERNLTAPDIELLKAVADVYKTSLDNLVGRKCEYENEAGDDITRQIVDVI
ncbi:MAG: helix-turn-helix transcriptional regulator, partial [Oscillospiraceae bacterium]|nr:helix-turn-helix transcriptional regulator [Oscillospiraceae bacterium]